MNWFEDDLRSLAASPFGDLAPAVRAEHARRLDALPAPSGPVVARIDHGWANVTLDREAGAVEAVLDWGATPADPRGFSLALAEYKLGCCWWMVRPGVPDWRPLVREALLAGYREAAAVPPDYPARRACYHLPMTVHQLLSFEKRAADADVPAERVEAAREERRAALERELDREYD